MKLYEHDEARLVALVRKLAATREAGCLEAKENFREGERIGKYISALSNSAALEQNPYAFIVWGIDDPTRKIVGSSFDPWAERWGNEHLHQYLVNFLDPRIGHEFHEVEVDGQRVVILILEAAERSPTKFNGQPYIRVGESLRKLSDIPDKERELWRVFHRYSFEDAPAIEALSATAVEAHLDVDTALRQLGLPPHTDPFQRLSALSDRALLEEESEGSWTIRNSAALLYSRDLQSVRGVSRHTVRVVRYFGSSRADRSSASVEGKVGYALGFEGLINYIMEMIPTAEAYDGAVRVDVPAVPYVAVREVVANALVHQDYSVTGAGPLIEIFNNRVEVTNPGSLLVDWRRIIDVAPRSRNETLAKLMREIGICEERGTGWDRIATACIEQQLPAPRIEESGDSIRVSLFYAKPVIELTAEERALAIYQQASLLFINEGKRLTNSDVRERFGIKQANAATATRYIQEAIDADLLAVYDLSAGPKYRSYVPYWVI